MQGTEKPRTVAVTMTMKRDPGYGATGRMIIESALCLVKQRTEVLKFSVRVPPPAAPWFARVPNAGGVARIRTRPRAAVVAS